MPWRGVTVSEQKRRFLEDYELNYYSVTELAERFGISRTTAYKWINRFKKHGQAGFREHSRRPHSCPWQTDAAIAEELVRFRKAHPHWAPRKHRWAADYKGQIRLKNGNYCFPLTVSDLSSRCLLGCFD